MYITESFINQIFCWSYINVVQGFTIDNLSYSSYLIQQEPGLWIFFNLPWNQECPLNQLIMLRVHQITPIDRQCLLFTHDVQLQENPHSPILRMGLISKDFQAFSPFCKGLIPKTSNGFLCNGPCIKEVETFKNSFQHVQKWSWHT